LLTERNIWLRAGALAGLIEAGAPGVDALLRQELKAHPPALLRAEMTVGLNTLAIAGRRASRSP